MSSQEAVSESSQLASRAVLEDLENQYVAVKKERDEAFTQLKTVQDEIKELQNQLTASQEWQTKSNKLESELTVCQQQIQSLNEEKKAVSERLDRMQAEADRLREEIRYVWLCDWLVRLKVRGYLSNECTLFFTAA